MGVWAFAVLHLHDGVVMACIDNFLLLHLGIGDIIDECPSYAATRASVDESILRTGVESILAIHKLGVEHHTALLTLGLEVWQTLPCLEVVCACYGCCGRGC